MGTWLETRSLQPVPLLLVDYLKRPAAPQVGSAICLPLIELGSLDDNTPSWVLKPPEAESPSTPRLTHFCLPDPGTRGSSPYSTEIPPPIGAGVS